jgi:hypothetical protein
MTRGIPERGRKRFVFALVLGWAACGPTTTVNRSSVVSEIGVTDAGNSGGAGGSPQSGGSGGAGSGGMASGGAGGAGGTGGADSGGSGGGGGMTGGTGGTAGTGGAGGNPNTGGTTMDATVDTTVPTPDAAPDTIQNADPVLMVTHALAGATANLTTVGKLDWVHWGYTNASSVNRKKNSPNLITMKKIGSQSQGHYDGRPATLTWTDGTPTTRGTDVTDGISTGDVDGVGFELRATGVSGRPRTLTIYLGGWQAAAKFTAQLGSGPGLSYSNSSFRATDPGVDRVYTVTFAPKDSSDVLVVRWALEDVLDTYGNLTLQAAALSE